MSNLNDFVIENGVLEKYAGSNAYVTIPDSVTSIGSWAFSDCSNLTSITIPDGVIRIGEGAFRGCKQLADADGFVIVRDILYDYLGNGGNVYIPDGVTSIGNGAFSRCSSLTSITIPDSVTSIENSAFSRCSSLTSITIPDSVTSIGSWAFSDCSSLTSITIPDSVTSIGKYAFSRCSSLTSITILNGVKSIEEQAFSYCSSLTSITIPDSVTSIENSAFFRCSSLTSITAPKISLEIFKEAGFAARAVMGFFENREDFIDEDIKNAYGKYAFSHKKKLLPEIFKKDLIQAIAFYAENGKITVKNIEKEFIAPAQEANAMQCLAYLLDWQNKNISQDEKDKQIERELTKDPFNATDMKKLWSYEKLENGTLMIKKFKGNLADIEIPSRIGKNKVTKIGDKAFLRCSNLTSITIPDSVTSIGVYAFSWCSSLTSITIPDSVQNIGDHAFCGCKQLADADGFVIVRDVLYDYIGNGGSVFIPEGVTSIENSAFSRCSSLTSITIPDSVTSIGSWAFSDCSSLTSIIIPDGVISIGEGEFRGCKQLADADGFVIVRDILYDYFGNGENVYIPDGVTSIGNDAFRDCSSLTSITIPDSVTSIGDEVFSGCESLTSITAPKISFEIFKEAGFAARAVMGFFENREDFIDVDIKNAYGKYAFSQKKKLLPEIFKKDLIQAIAFYAENGKITVKNIEEEFIAPAQEANAMQCLAYLLDWQNKNISQDEKDKQIERELTKDPFNATDMKKLWSYEKLENGTLMIKKFKGNLADVEIPCRIGKNAVTKIGDEAFSYCSSLTSITIPDGVTSIGNDAFRDCSSLTSITIPDSVTSIGSWAFSDCSSLTSVTIPDSVTSIGDEVFSGCESLTSITIPDSVTSIGSWAFYDCSRLTSITIPDSVTSIDDSAFDGIETSVCIHTSADSYAERFAKMKNIRLVIE